MFADTVAALQAEHDGAGPRLADLGAADPGGPRGFDPSGIELRGGDVRAVLPTLAAASVDFVATDPPYNVQLPMTMAGGKLAETHANRRTDYAMRSDLPEDLANLPDYPAYLDAMSEVLCEVHRVLRPGRYAVLIVRDAYQGGRYLFTAADLAARGAAEGLVPKGDITWYQAGTRLRPYGYPRSFVPNIAHQHILVLRKAPEPPGAPEGGAALGLAELPAVLVVGAHHVLEPAEHRAIVPGGPAVRGRRRRVDHDVAERHLVQPALAAVRAQDPPVRAALLEQDDLVALVEDRRSRRPGPRRDRVSRLTRR